MPKVYVVSKGFHDWEKASAFGEVVFLSKAPVNRMAVSCMARRFIPELENSSPDDLIVISGLSVMNTIAGAIFAMKHRRLNLLIYDSDNDRYVKRELIFDNDLALERIGELMKGE